LHFLQKESATQVRPLATFDRQPWHGGRSMLTTTLDSLQLPLLVFFAETIVLTLATLRTICIAKGNKRSAALLGFFEVCCWLFAIGQVMQNLSDFRCAVAFAAGFALGNYLGVFIEQKIAQRRSAFEKQSQRESNTEEANLAFVRA
jgi:hypothetical protein